MNVDIGGEKPLRKTIGVTHIIAECRTCGKEFSNHKNGQALAAKHAKNWGHLVRGEVGLAFIYDGRRNQMDNIDFLTENLRELEKLRYELDVYKQSCPICGNRYYNDPSIVTKLEKEGEELRKAGQVAFNAFDERYDGAPDSGMTWMVEPMLALQKALQTGGR